MRPRFDLSVTPHVSVNTAVFSEHTCSRTVTPNISVTIEYDLLAPSLHGTDEATVI